MYYVRINILSSSLLTNRITLSYYLLLCYGRKPVVRGGVRGDEFPLPMVRLSPSSIIFIINRKQKKKSELLLIFVNFTVKPTDIRKNDSVSCCRMFDMNVIQCYRHPDKNGRATTLHCRPITNVFISWADNSLVTFIDLILARSTRFMVTTATGATWGREDAKWTQVPPKILFVIINFHVQTITVRIYYFSVYVLKYFIINLQKIMVSWLLDSDNNDHKIHHHWHFAL